LHQINRVINAGHGLRTKVVPYRRSGFTPCPEDEIDIILLIIIIHLNIDFAIVLF